MSPFQRHRARMMGELAAVQAADPAAQRRGGAATEYELQRARLGVDLRRLHELQSVERKIELKRQLLPGYVDWVEGVMAANVATEDDILTHVMIWRLDVGDFAGALPLARFVLRHGLTLPERFSRTAPTLICEEIADAALKAIGQDQDFDIAILRDVEVLVIDEDIFDQVRAKLEKAIGLCLARAADAIEPDADGPAG
uniref:phage terminase small subunit n=1 Tax=Sphingomonas sp. TaxID=28214 RepID=UPI00289D75E6